MNRTTIMAGLIVLIAFGLTGCQSSSDRLREVEAAEQIAAAKRQLTEGAQTYNLGLCFDHLGVSRMTPDNSPAWRAFKKAHNITGRPIAMSDADLKACQDIKK